MDPYTRPRFVCDVCSKSYEHQTHLRRHKKSHAPKNVFCPECSYRTNKTELLRSHMNRMHLIDDVNDFKGGAENQRGMQYLLVQKNNLPEGADAETNRICLKLSEAIKLAQTLAEGPLTNAVTVSNSRGPYKKVFQKMADGSYELRVENADSSYFATINIVHLEAFKKFLYDLKTVAKQQVQRWISTKLKRRPLQPIGWTLLMKEEFFREITESFGDRYHYIAPYDAL